MSKAIPFPSEADVTQREVEALRSDMKAALARISALEEGLKPFAEICGEGDEDISDTASVTMHFGRTTHYALHLSDLRRARSLLSGDLVQSSSEQAEAQSGHLGYPLVLCGDHAEFEAEYAGVAPKDRPDWPLPSFDAKDWAQAFLAAYEKYPGDDFLDEGTMIAWFASALMRGYDQRSSEDLVQSDRSPDDELSGHLGSEDDELHWPEPKRTVIGKVMLWRPIETVPKDREVLLSDARTAGGFMQVAEWVEDEKYCWVVKDGPTHHRDLFTHWADLLPPPHEALVTEPIPQVEFETNLTQLISDTHQHIRDGLITRKHGLRKISELKTLQRAATAPEAQSASDVPGDTSSPAREH